MGTNYYYIKFKRCKECGNVTQDEIHIGKSSVGWKFHFHYEAFSDPKNWKEELKKKYIYNEYNEEILYKDFINLVESKQETIEPNKSNYFILGDNYFKINNYEFYTGEFS